MANARRWTNATFTHRVDHEAGAHRSARRVGSARVCEHCGNAFVRGRWVAADAAPPQVASLRAIAAPEITLCPACRMERLEQFGGEVRISGTFARAHRTEIVHLVKNEAERAAADNPLARILVTRETPDRLVVRTTTEHLAKRIGQALHKAFDGETHYEFSHENKFAHVTWSRDV